MNQEITILLFAAVSIGFFHTLLGPDHYLPFIMMAKARKWSLVKTSWITFLCGLGHIGSSVVLGCIGIALGIAVQKLVVIESLRGSIAAWLFLSLGLVYFFWGMRQAYRNKPHQHFHFHPGGDVHTHSHTHHNEHVHVHEEEAANITPWILFTIFVFGPCEPLIPLLMYPAAKNSVPVLLLVAIVFGAITITTMLGIVIVTSFGIQFLPTQRFERYTHAIAGGTIFICGAGMVFFGL